MKIGIVGSEGAKFTEAGKQQAFKIIRQILLEGATEVVSGHCHLGGIDIWAEEAAKELGITLTIFPPQVLSWEGGYKQRNLKIAHYSDVVHCITVDRLPNTFKGMTFNSCYHCGTIDHVKSGGCWTMKKSKIGRLHIVENVE